MKFHRGENLIKCPSAAIVTIIFHGLRGSVFVPACDFVAETKTKGRMGCVRGGSFE